ncbi:hypothetical protein Taro_005196 [Colocasia esculenta]|uniref:Uncharacterized protein n=1 Tax=Colocasia esculenta TaxID=4460 RepID=A0A843TTX5_COLES|nr:hypothetical protein [Colocasia esculenta]
MTGKFGGPVPNLECLFSRVPQVLCEPGTCVFVLRACPGMVCTIEVCVVFLDTLTLVFELYVRLRERRQGTTTELGPESLKVSGLDLQLCGLQGLAVDWVLASIVVDICCWFWRVPAMNLTASDLDVDPLAVQIGGKTHSPPFQVGRRRLPFQASLATPVLVCPSCLLWRLGDVLEREWLNRRLIRRLEMPRHHSRHSLCHRTHIVALFRHCRHLLLRQLRD